MTLSPVDRHTMLAKMHLIRAYEQRAVALRAAGHFPGICSSMGQEASAVGVMSALGPDDKILTNHRSAGHLLARGADAGRLMAEAMGRVDGYCRGKSGFLHVSAKELGVVLTSTIVGGELSMAPGVALAKTMLGQAGIVACFFGDGAACEGVFHESLNLASVWKLPLLYICENNQWQAYVARTETMVGDHVSAWAKGYGMASETVDGNDVEAVHAAAARAVALIHATGKPFLLETMTYRQRGHLEPDVPPAFDSHILPAWLQGDPLLRMQERMIANGTLTLAELDAMRSRAATAIDAAVEFANASPFPSLSELGTDVYAD